VSSIDRSFPREQRRRDRLGDGEAGQLVGQDCAHQRRAALVRARLHRGQARKRLDQWVEDRLAGVGSGIAEAGDRGVDDAGPDRSGVLVSQPQPLDHAGAEVLQHHIGPGDQPFQGGQAIGMLQIEGDRALVAVVIEERGGKPAPAGRDMAAVVTDARHLDLDHVSTLVG
jgi:hypothetical protein